MSIVGGSIESISLNGRNFPVAADADGQRKLGGDENDVQANGDGTGRLIKTKVPWQLEGITVGIDDARDDQDFIQDLADGNNFFPIAITFASGHVRQGVGQITGENPVSTQAQTAAISLMGTGKLTPQ